MNNKVSIFLTGILLVNLAVKPSAAVEENTASLTNNISSIDKAKIKIAQGTNSRVITLRLSDAGVSVGSVLAWGPAGLIQRRSTDWVRLEISGNQVKVVHTTRTTNWLTQFSKWWDHPVRKTIFKPDSCDINNESSSDIETQLREIKKLYESQLITKEQYQELQEKILNQIDTNSTQSTAVNSDCIISGEEGKIELEDITLLTKGTFQMEYLESGEWKYIAFRVPEKEYQ
ncbi:hypothetical protein [Nostoc sp. CCY0012]|uniref:hypothetical protein n=1 Tax=Nostoc sp. CCY0012 TaxID=1056123 RepID=UPI0039C6048D